MTSPCLRSMFHKMAYFLKCPQCAAVSFSKQAGMGTDNFWCVCGFGLGLNTGPILNNLCTQTRESSVWVHQSSTESFQAHLPMGSCMIAGQGQHSCPAVPCCALPQQVSLCSPRLMLGLVQHLGRDQLCTVIMLPAGGQRVIGGTVHGEKTTDNIQPTLKGDMMFHVWMGNSVN